MQRRYNRFRNTSKSRRKIIVQPGPPRPEGQVMPAEMFLMAYRSQLCFGNSGLFNIYILCVGCPAVNYIENGGTNKNGKKQGYEIHADTKKEGVPAANCGESGFRSHWIKI